MRRVRSRYDSQFVPGHLEVAREIFTHVGERKRAFQIVGNSLIRFVYRVRTKVGIIPIDRLAIITWS
jgi:hypothetical protein